MYYIGIDIYMASLVAKMIKNPPAMKETWVPFLGWEDPLEEGMATSLVFLPGESPWAEKPGRLQSIGSQRVGYDWDTQLSTEHTSIRGFPDGSAVKHPPTRQETQEMQVWFLGQEDSMEEEMTLHSSILAWKNSMNRGAWQARVHRVTKTCTWLSC